MRVCIRQTRVGCWLSELDDARLRAPFGQSDELHTGLLDARNPSAVAFRNFNSVPYGKFILRADDIGLCTVRRPGRARPGLRRLTRFPTWIPSHAPLHSLCGVHVSCRKPAL